MCFQHTNAKSTRLSQKFMQLELQAANIKHDGVEDYVSQVFGWIGKRFQFNPDNIGWKVVCLEGGLNDKDSTELQRNHGDKIDFVEFTKPADTASVAIESFHITTQDALNGIAIFLKNIHAKEQGS